MIADRPQRFNAHDHNCGAITGLCPPGHALAHLSDRASRAAPIMGICVCRAPLSHSVRRACRRRLGERLCDVFHHARRPNLVRWIARREVFRRRGTGLSVGSCALPVATNSPHFSTSRPSRGCSMLAFDLQSPLTESNRRPSPYHKHGSPPRVLWLALMNPRARSECPERPQFTRSRSTTRSTTVTDR